MFNRLLSTGILARLFGTQTLRQASFPSTHTHPVGMSSESANEPVSCEKAADALAEEEVLTPAEKKRRDYLLLKEERKRNLKMRRQQKKAAKSAGIGNESLMLTKYYFENGLRKVYPYFFAWNTTAKERWFGRTLYDIYSTEFSRAIRNLPLMELIETGKIQVNGEVKPNDYKIKNGDRISHVKHRHEIPVLDDEIKIIHEDQDYLVLNKPCSLPMHPCGKYRYNTLTSILTKEMGYSNIRTQYRLDRLTSGLVVVGKNFKSSQLVDKHIKERTAKKTYLCRVVGEFPTERMKVEAPIDCASRKIGLYWVDEANGKESITEFERVSYNGKTSVVLCYPKTGRTHQIRIHLQYLGYPIVNDPLYNMPDVWGAGNGKGGKYAYSKEVIEQNFMNAHSYEAWIIKQEGAEEDGDNDNPRADGETREESKPAEEAREASPKKLEDSSLESNTKRKQETEDVLIREEIEAKKPKLEEELAPSIAQIAEEKASPNQPDSKGRPGFDSKLLETDPDCFECKQVYRDPVRSDLIMYLHAYSYRFGDLEFKTEYPEWAKEDFVE